MGDPAAFYNIHYCPRFLKGRNPIHPSVLIQWQLTATVCTSVQNDRGEKNKCSQAARAHVWKTWQQQHLDGLDNKYSKHAGAPGQEVKLGILSKTTMLVFAVFRGSARLRFPGTTREVSSPVIVFLLLSLNHCWLPVGRSLPLCATPEWFHGLENLSKASEISSLKSPETLESNKSLKCRGFFRGEQPF